MKFEFEIGQEVYRLETSGYYFYVRYGKVKSYCVYSDKVEYRISGGNLNGEYDRRELLTKEEVIEKLKKWLG